MSLSGYAYARHLNKQRLIVKPEDVVWHFDTATTKWIPNGTPPACPTILSKSPVDTRLVTAVSYPGQYRDQGYNANGNLTFDDSNNGDISVYLPMNAKLTRLSSYIENGDQQYSLFFVNPCGLAVKFDHLLTLSDKYQKIVAQLRPNAAVNSVSVPVEPPIRAKAGELVATAVGVPSERNVSVDFGVYDLRAQNQISKNLSWTYYHQVFKSTEWFGVCWFNMMPKDDAARINSILQADISDKSDYCQVPAGSTI